MRSHGALMFTGWVVLVPLGILAALHRWVRPTGTLRAKWSEVADRVGMQWAAPRALGTSRPGSSVCGLMVMHVAKKGRVKSSCM